jgi:Skp family chaperone for outer membrane proteins
MSKRLFVALLIAIFALFVKNGYSAQNSESIQKSSIGIFAVVDTTALAERIGEYKIELDRLDAEFLPRTKELDNLKKRFVEMENELRAKRPNLAPIAYQQEFEKFQVIKKEYERKAEDYQFDLQRRSDKVLAPIRKKILDFMMTYADQHNIIATFDLSLLTQGGLLFFNQGINITEEIIKEYNKKYPVNK